MFASPQPAILLPPPVVGRSTTMRLKAGTDARALLLRLAAGWQTQWGVLGLGAPIMKVLGSDIPGLRPFPEIAGPVAIPITQGDLWVVLRGDDRSEVFERGDALAALLGDDVEIQDSVETFLHDGGRDLTGYRDGSANPPPEDVPGVALCGDASPTPGASFVAVQRWRHDLGRFRAHPAKERDLMIGRRIADDEEIDDAPDSCHVKRTAQETYEPEAFMVRRSMPFASATECGLEFISYCRTLDAFERMLKHMAGLDDGIVDDLFRFSRPVTGGFYWCPATKGGKLDFSPLVIGA